MSKLICPDCKWESPEGYYRYSKNKLIEVPLDGDLSCNKTYYPIILEKIKQGNCITYREVHRCAKCFLEIEIQRYIIISN